MAETHLTQKIYYHICGANEIPLIPFFSYLQLIQKDKRYEIAKI